MPKDFFTAQLRQRFTDQKYITRNELYDFYRTFEPDLKETTFGWRIYALKEKNVLKPVRQGVYTLSLNPQFHPELEPKLKEIASKVQSHFPAARYCVWSTRWLNDWMVHQPGRFLQLVEIEALATESVFYFLKDEGHKQVFLNPDNSLLERYIYEEQETIIVKPLVTKAPVKKEKGIVIPTLEKILVDLFTETKLFAPFQGSELENIFNKVYQMYTLNVTKLLAYSKRRSKEPELLDFITKNAELVKLLQE